MSSRQIVAYTVILLFLALPMIALPFVGRQILERLEFSCPNAVQGTPITDPSLMIRLVTTPLIGLVEDDTKTLVAAIDLPTREVAAQLCAKSAYVNDAIQIYAASNPNRVDPIRDMVDNDPRLVRFLNQEFPTFFIIKARITPQMAYQGEALRMDIYECSGNSFRRVAAKTER